MLLQTRFPVTFGRDKLALRHRLPIQASVTTGFDTAFVVYSDSGYSGFVNNTDLMFRFKKNCRMLSLKLIFLEKLKKKIGRESIKNRNPR